jgi:DNA polymerase III delta prime subunit
LETISKKTAIHIEKEGGARSFIDTGIYIFNALLSRSITKGGISKNRITVLAGPTGVGKSYLCYNIARNAQKDNYRIIFIDTEYSVELQDFEDFGIDTSEDKFVLLRSNKVEDLKLTLTQLLESLKQQKLKGVDIGKNMIFLDSIGQLASLKEVEDAMEGKNKADMSRAKAIKSLFRIINTDLGYLDIPLVATNHIYMCLTGENEIQMSDGTFKEIKLVNVGDTIKTLEGDKEVMNVFEYENSDIMKITLENGEIIKCTPNHKFLVKPEWNNDEDSECWKSASELLESDTILKIVD